MQTIGVDFDGVIHAYTHGWQNGEIYDEPIFDAFVGLRTLQWMGYAVFVFTAREDLAPVADWITMWSGMETVVDDFLPGDVRRVKFWNDSRRLLVTNRKLPAAYYVDDRAVHFTTWAATLKEISGE